MPTDSAGRAALHDAPCLASTSTIDWSAARSVPRVRSRHTDCAAHRGARTCTPRHASHDIYTASPPSGSTLHDSTPPGPRTRPPPQPRAPSPPRRSPPAPTAHSAHPCDRLAPMRPHTSGRLASHARTPLPPSLPSPPSPPSTPPARALTTTRAGTATQPRRRAPSDGPGHHPCDPAHAPRAASPSLALWRTRDAASRDTLAQDARDRFGPRRRSDSLRAYPYPLRSAPSHSLHAITGLQMEVTELVKYTPARRASRNRHLMTTTPPRPRANAASPGRRTAPRAPAADRARPCTVHSPGCGPADPSRVDPWSCHPPVRHRCRRLTRPSVRVPRRPALRHTACTADVAHPRSTAE